MAAFKRGRESDLGIKSVEDKKVAAGSREMSRLNPEDNHKGLSHPALLEILKTAAKRARDTYSSASALMTEMSRQSFGEERGV